MDLDDKYVAPYYAMAPVVMERGERIYLWDVDGRKYYDMMAGFAAVGQGHCHPKIRQALMDQSAKLTLCSRSLNQAVLPETAEYVCKLLGYDKFLPQNGGCEAVEAACKVARRWGYVVKGVPDDTANILGMNDAFWGRSIAASGSCGVPDRIYKFGPATPGFSTVDYNDA
jgi:ornithine--oxo-acid transaminase